jgi:hypothetical protein
LSAAFVKYGTQILCLSRRAHVAMGGVMKAFHRWATGFIGSIALAAALAGCGGEVTEGPDSVALEQRASTAVAVQADTRNKSAVSDGQKALSALEDSASRLIGTLSAVRFNHTGAGATQGSSTAWTLAKTGSVDSSA